MHRCYGDGSSSNRPGRVSCRITFLCTVQIGRRANSQIHKQRELMRVNSRMNYQTVQSSSVRTYIISAVSEINCRAQLLQERTQIKLK